MKLEETVITQAGVMRCCLYTVAIEYEGKEVELGDKSHCPHCHTKFTLVTRKGVMPSYYDPEKWKTPIWTPDWQLEK